MIIFTILKHSPLEERNASESHTTLEKAKKLLKRNCDYISDDGWDGRNLFTGIKYEIQENMLDPK